MRKAASYTWGAEWGNSETVMKIHEASGRGAIPEILEYRPPDGAAGFVRALADVEIHLWTFDAEGRVNAFPHFMDNEARWHIVRS